MYQQPQYSYNQVPFVSKHGAGNMESLATPQMENVKSVILSEQAESMSSHGFTQLTGLFFNDVTSTDIMLKEGTTSSVYNGGVVVNGSQSFHFTPTDTEQQMNNSSSYTPEGGNSVGLAPVKANETRGSRSFQFIDDRWEKEVDGTPMPSLDFDLGLIKEPTTIGWMPDLLTLINQNGTGDPLTQTKQLETVESSNLHQLQPAFTIIDTEQLVTEVSPQQPHNNVEDFQLSFFDRPTFPEESKTDCDRDMVSTNPDEQQACQSTVVNLCPSPPPPEEPSRIRETKKMKSRQKDDMSTNKSKRLRMYEITKPFEDKQLEKKRLDAIRARKNRERSHVDVKTLQEDLARAIAERDALKKEVAQLKAKEGALEKRLLHQGGTTSYLVVNVIPSTSVNGITEPNVANNNVFSV